VTVDFEIWGEWQTELYFLHLVGVYNGSSRILNLRCSLRYFLSFVGDLISDLTSTTVYRLQNVHATQIVVHW